MLHRLGTLHLDPYTAGRRSTNYQQDIYRWQQRFLTEFGEELVGLPEDEWRMPAPEEALHLAEQYLRQAVAARQGLAKGLSLKALIQTLEWLEVLNQPIDQAELVDLCHEALDLLEPDQAPEQRLAVLATLSRQDQPVDPAEVDRTLEASLDEYVRRRGAPSTIDLVQQAVSVLQRDAPLRSLELMHRAASLFERYGGETFRVNQWLNVLNLIRQAVAPPLPAQLPQGGLQAAAGQLLKQGQEEGWDIRTVSAGLIALASYAEQWDEEKAALALLDEARGLAPLFTDDHADALAFLQCNLLLGIGVNEVNAGNWGPAVEAYTEALWQYLSLDLVDASTDCLRRVDDLATRFGPEVAVQVVAGLAPLALRLETGLGEPATRLIQHICKRTVAAMMNQAINPEVLSFLLQVAKGLRFATALYAGSRYNWREDERGLRLLRQIEEREAALPPDSPLIVPADPEALLDKDMILTAYTRPDERQAGDTSAERLVNLQHSYDAHLNERLLSGIPSQESLYLSTQDVQDALDQRTVLLNFYLGASVDGRIAVYLLALTREDVKASVVVHEFPDSQVVMGHEDRELQMSPFAVTIQSLRHNLVAEPGPRLVDRDAGRTLETDLRGYLGHLVEYLDEVRATGKDHLCIVPHGPLHYYPLHLLGEVGKPLVEQWIVTYLPNLHLLMSRRGQPAVRRHRERDLTAIGLSFEGTTRPGLPPIPQSISEARQVAGIFETEALVEEQATERSVLEAFNQSRYVHLSTHGWHNVNAPAFQCLYLTPDGESDGRLHAHELLSLDLRGLELLTLSACETALGRFDAGDNLRGLPASFLLAGVSTIVGTLWPVEANASEHFFTALYRQLRAGTGQLDAFATAQRETRAAFPKYRDWGPFYLIGDWL
jgi:CHAT domain-containing protein